jgi:hypothetical protein
MKLGTIVKVITEYNQDRIGVVIDCDSLPPWAEAFVKLDNNGGSYAFSKNELEII